MTDHMTPFGLRDSRLYEPAQVSSGLACACICPGCGAALVAKKGNEKRWHYSHHNVRPGESCAESAIHAAAKQVLLDHGELVVPEVSFAISALTDAGAVLHERDVLSPIGRIRFERSLSEVTFADVRPDVVGYHGERQLLAEMCFRHRVDPIKRKKLEKLGLPALEIDLSDLDPLSGFASVAERVIEDTSRKEWLLYPRRNEHLAYLEYKLQERVDQANDAYREELRQIALAKTEHVRRRQARQAAEIVADMVFAQSTTAEQETWLRQALDLEGAIPAFVAQRLYA